MASLLLNFELYRMLSLSIAHIFMRDYVWNKNIMITPRYTRYKSNVFKIYASPFIFDAFQHFCDLYAIVKACKQYT